MTTSNIEIGEYDFTPREPAFVIGRPLSKQLQPITLSIDCETIILNKRDLDISFKLEAVKIENFDRLTINGITFVRETTNE